MTPRRRRSIIKEKVKVEEKMEMTLEEYKKDIEKRLLESNNQTSTKALMKLYEEDFETYYKEGLTVNMVATMMEIG